MAENTVLFPDLALDKLFGFDSDDDAISLLLTVEMKLYFSLGSPAADNAERTTYLFRRKTLSSSFLRGPAAKVHADSVNATAKRGISNDNRIF